jgi:hypothetical protein
MKNAILLDSTWVDLHNEHIIWYALLHFFAITLNLLENSNKFKATAKTLY